MRFIGTFLATAMAMAMALVSVASSSTAAASTKTTTSSKSATTTPVTLKSSTTTLKPTSSTTTTTKLASTTQSSITTKSSTMKSTSSTTLTSSKSIKTTAPSLISTKSTSMTTLTGSSEVTTNTTLTTSTSRTSSMPTTSASKTSSTPPSTKSTPTTTSTSTTLITTTKPTSTAPLTTTSSLSTSRDTTSTSPTTTSSHPRVSLAGVNIAGCDFGCNSEGICSGGSCPSVVGPQQMTHFVHNDSLNIFRLPVGWQYLINSNLGGPLYAPYFSTYDALVQSCLSLGAHCIVDVHNYARYDGLVIGQSGPLLGPTDADFANLWSQLAGFYANASRVVFGVMNEPHDILNMTAWATTVQAAVDAIRGAGATSQLILLPGTDYTSAMEFPNASAPYLSAVKDHDGTTERLIYDVHQYLNADGSGDTDDCVTDHVDDAFAPLATYLREQGRRALLTETGGGNTTSCFSYLCSTLDYLNKNHDVYLGYVGWAAGAFDQTYATSETPDGNVDLPIVQLCIAGRFQ